MTYNPWGDLADRHPLVDVEYAPTGRHDGWWDADRGVIVLNNRLTQVERRCTLAHEIAHLDRGDTCLHESYPDARRQDHRTEEAAHAEAARRLIDARLLAQALAVFGEGDLDLVADELWVDLDTLLARLDHLHPTERGLIRHALDQKEDAA